MEPIRDPSDTASAANHSESGRQIGCLVALICLLVITLALTFFGGTVGRLLGM